MKGNGWMLFHILIYRAQQAFEFVWLPLQGETMTLTPIIQTH